MALPTHFAGQDWETMLAQAKQDPTATLKGLQDKYAGYGQDRASALSHMSTMGGADTFIGSLANGAGAGASFGEDQKKQAVIDGMIANQLYAGGTSNSRMYDAFLDNFAQKQYDPAELRSMRMQMDAAGGMDNFFGNTANSTREQLNLQRQLRGAVEDPFAGQNLEDGAVKAQVLEYQKRNPNYIPVNTYRGQAPGLPGSINQDTGRMYQENGTNENPWIGNKGFLQTNLLTDPQKQLYQAYQGQQQRPQQQQAYGVGAASTVQSSARPTTGGYNFTAPTMPQQQQPQQQSGYGFNPAGTSQPRPTTGGYQAAMPNSLGYAKQRQRVMGYE